MKQLKNGYAMPAFGFGTWQIGGDTRKSPVNDDLGQTAALVRAIEAGVTHIDTAERYAAGHAEEIVAEAIKNFERKKLFIVSKVWPDHLKYKDVLKSAMASLKRLKTVYLDMYLIHLPNHAIPIAETMKAMDKLKNEGLIKNIGVSNFSVSSFKEAQKTTQNKIAANQVHYNLIYREPEKSDLLSFCQKNDVLLIAWRPVEKGMLAGGGIPLLDTLCRKYKKSPVQIAINWLISQKNVVTLAKMVEEKHLRENLAALDFEMEKKDIEKLRQDFPGQKSISSAVPLQ
ncbi:hypothetical protein A3D78_06410 [Candidatus Gottesmanbacteria bacterium RIFCSPHIGHO2_02_FULL_39_14]|uniref:NADP-dependent oxidoreductase domain-containing protein n=1 Tax=Candidatus Gottesmanbacteria bacterium RIFCSPHIGHO2_02_FULL_39_14 TaxID=1798383 RepID=A0A1F5ZXL0_9BACT|nr:MAG: hypothetical protein A3D78_06410 [Candidatus Gottesmanbacteria bacterium RIFCSPHIGHO2_02_FULL_39_14]